LSGVFTVEDRGGSISGNRIDIWFPTHGEALQWGRRTVTITAVD
jgi:3D (Asp-Asp-Asp) domain-containing protein